MSPTNTTPSHAQTPAARLHEIERRLQRLPIMSDSPDYQDQLARRAALIAERDQLRGILVSPPSPPHD